ncbi:MAG TPA: S9 family peptidase, partial [Xanthobacteraceae bacterium]
MSSSAKTAPYGSWKSPITSDLIVAQSISLSDVRLDGGQIYWLEGRPQEQGRSVVVRADADGRRIDVTPAPSNVRTRVHEYGGGAWTVWDGT